LLHLLSLQSSAPIGSIWQRTTSHQLSYITTQTAPRAALVRVTSSCAHSRETKRIAANNSQTPGSQPLGVGSSEFRPSPWFTKTGLATTARWGYGDETDTHTLRQLEQYQEPELRLFPTVITERGRRTRTHDLASPAPEFEVIVS